MNNSKFSLDYKKLGLICGIEIHQQLNTNKLFCDCPCITEDVKNLNKEFTRKIRFSLSETGDVDVAALEEFKKGKSNIYKYNDKTSCLVELDEEPPHEVNEKAMEVAIKISQMLNMSIFDKIVFMRKIIINGSITSGFQRTSLIGINGFVDIDVSSNVSKKVEKKKIIINAINLEEDSARPLASSDGVNVFGLDRLGIPLIEVTTGPNMHTPSEAYIVAKYLGNVLRSFKELKRGIGTIRQDLNVSIRGGTRVELKGVQSLQLIPEIIDNEIQRQVALLNIIAKVRKLKLTKDNFSDFKICNITDVLKKSDSKVVQNILKNKGEFLGIKLNKLSGILGMEVQKDCRFATEISDKVKVNFHQIKGLFHGDELPKYGITVDEVDKIKNKLNISTGDNYIIIGNDKSISKNALNYILEILKDMLFEVTPEVRKIEGISSKYMRPMPGSSRMYPETDVPIVDIKDKKKKYQKDLPELLNLKINRLSKLWSLNDVVVGKVLNVTTEDNFNQYIKLLKPTQVVNVLVDIPNELKIENFYEKVLHDDFIRIFEYMMQDKIDKKFVMKMFIDLNNDKGDKFISIESYLKNNVIEMDDNEIKKVVKEIIKNNTDAPMGELIRKTMEHFKGQVAGKKISAIIQKEK